MSGLSNSLSILFLTIQWLGLVLPAPTVNHKDASDRLVSYDIQIDRQSDVLLPELEIQLLQAQRQQDDLEVLRMQLMQLNLLKLLIALDCFILLCIYFYAREEKYHQVQLI
ncbi:uncharacterized protein LOC128255405 [Drosophila gunungcola]|uniref:Uncharacterized protein n=1 Tax=Drosophila gunungcola TaxID=103775 RepID=A0A9P9YX54_9MUSC|nr:uncharacterized protein LOC128255405 [Drosophila gunungcola]KAI8044324.1 hypothetical protein M5D96_000478 [Drosophila gunungcola]